MDAFLTTLSAVSAFTIISLASKQIGQFLKKIQLPLITGFLFTGIIAGPYVLNLIPHEAVHHLRFIDELALTVIALAAGNELYLKEIRDRFKSITWVTLGLVVATFALSTVAILFLARFIPFMQLLSFKTQLAIAILGAAVLVARSPSSAIAIVNEMRAKGPFTRTVLGVIMIGDVVVILLFGLNSSLADALVHNLAFNLGFILILLLELLVSLAIGWLIYWIAKWLLSSRIHPKLRIVLLLLVGYAVFPFSVVLREFIHNQFGLEFLIEPLLICMTAGFLITNYSLHRDYFGRILHDISPPIYVLFFTLTGAFLSLDILLATWKIALVLFSVRLLTIVLGAWLGGSIAGDPPEQNRVAWMAYLTQAGVGLGLAKEIALDFPTWGDSFATILISVIVLNQIVGPPFFKWVIKFVKESHARSENMGFDGERNAILFGLKAQSISLARQLMAHGWLVKLVCTTEDCQTQAVVEDIETHIMDRIELEDLQKLEAGKADAVVSFFDSDTSYKVLEMFYEHFGTQTMVVRLKDRSDFERFHQLGVLVVEPQTAVVSLLEHYVRAPVGTSLLLGMGEDQDMIDLEITDPALDGVSLRDLRLPMEVLILSVQRGQHTLVSRGHLQFKLGDKLTVVGPNEKLEEARLLFDK